MNCQLCFVQPPAEAHLEKHLHLQRWEAIAFFDTWIPFKEGACGDASTHPLDGDHLTVAGYECRLRMLLYKCSLNSWQNKRYGYSDELYIQKYKYKIQSMWYEVTDVHDMQGFQ